MVTGTHPLMLRLVIYPHNPLMNWLRFFSKVFWVGSVIGERESSFFLGFLLTLQPPLLPFMHGLWIVGYAAYGSWCLWVGPFNLTLLDSCLFATLLFCKWEDDYLPFCLVSWMFGQCNFSNVGEILSNWWKHFCDLSAYLPFWYQTQFWGKMLTWKQLFILVRPSGKTFLDVGLRQTYYRDSWRI